MKTLDFQVIEEQEVSKEVPALSAECLFEKEYKELIAGRDDSVFFVVEYFVPYCMLEGISADTIWNENVVAFTDKEAVTLVPVEDQKISKDGVRIYDIYHTYH